MNNRIPNDIDQQLKEYRRQQVAASGNRRDLYRDYDRSTITSNLSDLDNIESLGSETSQGFLSSLWSDTKDNFSNLWNSINQEMDEQDIDAKEATVLDLEQDKADLEHIQRYLSLVKSRDSLLNKLNNDPSISQWSIEDTMKMKDQLDALNSQIKDLDDYFKGEGRTHRVIAENMYDGARINSTDVVIPWEAIKRGWQQSGVTIDWYKHGLAAGLVGSAIEGTTNLFAKPAGVLGEIASGAYGEAKDIYNRVTSSARGNATAIRDYIQNMAQDGDSAIDALYLGENISKIGNVDSDLKQKYDNVVRDINAGIADVREEQDDLKNGRIFGINGLYDKDAITQDWKLGREEFQNGSLFGAFLHPFYATADIASSLDMMKYQIAAMGVDAAIRHLPEAFVKKIPGLGTALTVADVATGVGASLLSRRDETALEAIQAVGERTGRLAEQLGGDPQQILDKIRKQGSAAGIDVDALDEGQLWKLGIVLDVYAGEEFEVAKKQARAGVNKLINANNALGIMDWAESVPYMSYFGDVVKALKVPGRAIRDNFYIGEKTLGQRLGTQIYAPDSRVMTFGERMGYGEIRPVTSNFKYAEDMASRVDGIFDATVNKAVTRFVNQNHAKVALYTKHIANFAKGQTKKLAATGAIESIEEGQQHLLQERFNRGEYDDYNRETSMFDINEFVMNNGLAATAVADYFGLGFWDGNNGDQNLVKAMNIGFWSSLVQSKLFHSFGNITQPTSDNIRGLARQLRSDNVAVRILADQQKTLQDQTHIDMFYDRFMGGANHANLVESLSTLARAIDKSAPITITDPNTGQKRSMAVQYAKNILSDDEFKEATGYTKDEYDRVTDTVKKEFIEDDIKLMTATWTLFSDDNINKEMKKRGISKKSDKYRQYLRDGATAIIDYHKSSELLDNQKQKLDKMQDDHIELLVKLFDENVSMEEKRNIMQSKPKFADMVDRFNKSYRSYLKDHANQPNISFDEWSNGINTGEDLYKKVGKEAIEKFGIDEDLTKKSRKKQRGKKNKESAKQKVDPARIMADRIIERGKLRDLYESINPDREKQFRDKIKDKKSFRNNRYVNDWIAANKPHLRPWLGDLDRVWDAEDKTERDEILKGAYSEYLKPVSKKEFIERRIRIMHQYKKMQAVLDNMKWAEDQASALEQVRYMTGLDVDPSKVQGWVKHYQTQLEDLKKQENHLVGNDTNYKEVFGEDYKFDDDDEYQKLYADYALNQAIRAAQATVMAAYTTIQANPESLKTAIFGYGSEGTVLDENASAYKRRLDEYNALSTAEKDEYTDQTLFEDLKKMSNEAAWKLIDSRINEQLERRKVAHRQMEQESRKRIVTQQTDDRGDQQTSTEEPITRNSDDEQKAPSQAEQQLRREFYHETGKKKSEKELLEERRQQKQKQQEEGGESATPEETKPEETPASSESEPVHKEEPKSESEPAPAAPETPITSPEPVIGEGEEVVPMTEGVDSSNIDAAIDSSDDTNPDDAIGEEEAPEFIGEDIEPDRIDIDPNAEDVELPEDPTYVEQDALTYGLVHEDETTGILDVDGEVLSEEEERRVRQDFDDIDRSEDTPLTIDEVQDMSDKPIDDVVGELPVNMVWQTCFYKFDEETTPIKLTVNGKQLTEFNGKPLRPGAELAKKLLSPTWLQSCSTYYVVTQSEVSKNVDPNDPDAFTVALIIEDKDASYATVFRSLGDVISIDTKNQGRDGKQKQYHINRREDLKNWLLVKNMDASKVISYSEMDINFPSRKADDTDDTYNAKLAYYRQQVVKAYNKAVNDYAREMYAKEQSQLHRDDSKASERARKEWDSISKRRGESDPDYKTRLDLWNQEHLRFRNMARAYFSKPAKTVFTEEQVEEELNKLKANRDAIINAYLDKEGDKYIFPDSPKIGAVTPANVTQNNGAINNQKTKGGIPIFRTIMDEDSSIDEIQDALDSEDLLIGVGKGERAKLSGAKSIVSFGHLLGDEERVFFKEGGLSGKLYWIVSSLMGKGQVPIMLGEEKFDIQHREADKGGLETVSTRGGVNKIKLLIDKISGRLEVKNDKYKPSAAEVLLYMILGENVLPGFADVKSLVPLFINEDAGTLLETQPQSKDGLINNLAAKQLYFGPSVHTETITLENGSKQTRRVVSDDTWMFNIGLKQTTQLKNICDSLGEGRIVAEDGSYRLMQFTKEQILQNEALRQYIVQAISEQMHWNTDAATFQESASVAIQSSPLGALIRHLITKDAEAGRFDDMTPEEYLNSEVSIMDCPQLSFRIGDFYTMPESGSARNLASLKPRKGSILTWMIKSGHIKTDVGEDIFKAPFVFANGVKTPKNDRPAERAAKNTGLPVDTTPEVSASIVPESDYDNDENPFYDENKQQKVISKLPVVIRESGIVFEKSKKAIKEKLEKLTSFLLSTGARNSKFLDRVDVKENDILAAILLEDRTVDDIMEYAGEIGELIDEENDDDLNRIDKQMHDEKVKSLIEKYNKDYKTNLSESDIVEDNVLKYSARQSQTDAVEIVTFYKNKETGKTHLRIDSVKSSEVHDKNARKIAIQERNYFIKGVTGVYQSKKSKGKFNEEKARKWLSETLGIDPANVMVMNGIKSAVDDNEVFGVVDAAVNTITGELFGYIGLSRRGGIGSQYHEAWHYVNLLIHDEQTRIAIYKAYLNSHPWLKYKKPKYGEVEELLAEDFRKWIELEEDRSIKGSILRMFNNVLDTIFIFKNKRAYKEVFKQIRNGAYKGTPLSKQAVKEFHDAYHRNGGVYQIGYYVPSLTEQEDETFDYIVDHQQLMDASAALAKHFISSQKLETERDLKRISGTLVSDIQAYLQNWVETSDDILEENKNLLRDVLKNPERVKQSISEYFEELGLTFKIRKLKDLDKAKRLIDTKSSSLEEVDSNTENEAEEKEDRPDNTWDVFDLSVSKKDNASIRTKLFMKQIPVLQRNIDDNGKITYTQKRDAFGNEEMWSYSHAWNQITDKLWLCESIDAVDGQGKYLSTSMMGMVERLAKGNVFFAALLDKLTNIDSSKFQNTILKSQLYATINSNKPQVSFLTLYDPEGRNTVDFDDYDTGSDSMEDNGVEIVSNTSIADRQREWKMSNDNTLEANKNTIREWSQSITGQGLIDITGNKNTVSSIFADVLSTKIGNVRSKLDEYYNNSLINDTELNSAIRNVLIPLIIDLYDEIGISTDEDVIYEFIKQTLEKSDPTVREQLQVLKSQFAKTETVNVKGKQKEKDLSQDSIPRVIDAIIAAGKSTSKEDFIKFNGDTRSHSLDKLFHGFANDESSSVYRFASSMNAVHPSARQFSVKDPSGNTIYPISSNSFVSDRVRTMSVDGKKFGARMAKSKYCGHSQLLDIAQNETDPIDTNSHFKLNAFVGIKDGNRNIGADYFGITPMEDYLAKLQMLERDQIVLPTMADKKTWYSISHKNLKLVHDAILFTPYKDVLNPIIYSQYAKEHTAPVDDKELRDWQYDARKWYQNLDPKSDEKIRIDNAAKDAYNDYSQGIGLRKYSDDTLTKLANYMQDELEAVIAYYDPKNVRRVVKNSNLLVENYHGKVENGRLDFSGNGGKFRYFYDAITFTDKTGMVYNLNQRLQMLFELQKKIEKGDVKNIASDDPMFKYVGGMALGNKDKSQLDGFELIRQELESIRKQFFNNGFPSKAIKSSINDIFMKRTIEELDKLSDPQSPVKIVKKENGTYVPEIIPVGLLNKYVNAIYGKVANKQTNDAYSDVTIQNNGILSDALFSLIANYAVNSAVSVIEFEKVFSGDPAFYSRKKAKDNPKSTINERVSLQDGSVADVKIDVDNIYDAFSDKIKRLGSTLSPGDEIRLYYSKEELEKKGRRILSIDRYTNMNVEDIEMQSTFIDIIEKSFKKQLLVDNIRNLDTDKFKRWCEDNGMSFEQGLQKIYDDDNHFKKVYALFKNRQAAIERELKTQIKPYTEINVSDAQVFIRPEMYRRIRIGLGQWSNNDEQAYMILEGHKSEHKNGSWLSDAKVYNAVRQLQLYPLKMTYFQNDPTDDGGRKENPSFEYNKPILNKMAIFPWFRFMAGNGVGAEIYKRMNKKGNELDMISFKSAVKVGASQKAAKMKEDGATGENQLCSIEDLFNKDSSQYIDYDDNADNTNYGKTKSNATGSVPVEIQYLQNLRYQLNTEAHEAESRNIGTQMFKLAFSSIIDDAIYGADENGNGGKYGYQIKAEIMSTVKHLTNLGIQNLHKRFFTDDPNTGYRIDMDAVHDFVISIARSNGLGYSAEQIARNGVAACLARREVFENSATSIVNSEVIDINTPGGTAVQQSSFGFSGYGNRNVTSQIGAFKINFNNGEMLKWHTDNNSMEVMLSINFFKHVLPEDIKKKPFEEQRQWLVDHNIVKGKKTDGDDSTPDPFGIGYRIPTQGLSSIFGFTVADVLPPQCGDLIIVPPEFTAQTGSDFDVDKLFLATKAYVNGEYEQFSEDNPTKGGLTNKLLECYIELLCDNKNYSESRASIDTFTKMLKDELINAEGVLRDPQDSYIPSCTELMPFFQMNRKLEFSVGKAGIAPFALNVTNLALTQYSHLTMRYEGVIKEYDFGSLDAIDGKDGRRISGWLSAMVNAHVDVAKDPYIFDLNVNHATYNYANFLIRAGKGISTFTFLSQQSLKNIASDINNSGGLYGSNPFGDSPTEEINNISKNAAIKAEYKRLLSRLESLRKDYERSDKKQLNASEAVKLDHIIDYLDYILMPEKGKGNTKKKYRDAHGSAPEFEFDRKLVFDKDYAIKQIKNKRSSKQSDLLQHIEFQVACVRAFEELSTHAQAISDLVSVSQIDTKKFGNTIRDHINFDNKIQHFIENSSMWTINQEGFDEQFKDEKGRVDHKRAGKEAVRRYFEDSYLRHKFESATSNVKEILKTQLVTATDEYDLAFKSVMCKLNGGTGLLYDREFSQDKIDAIGEALDNLFRFNIMFNVGKDMRYMNENAIDLTLGGNKQAVIQKMHDLLYGSENVKPLYKRLDELKRGLKSKDAVIKYPDLVDENGQYHNDLLDALIPLSPTKNVEIGRINIRLQSRDTTTDQKSRLIASFAQLLDSSNTDVSDFAKDLVFYAYYSNYDQDVRNSFFDLVPPSYREQYDWAINSTLYHLAFSDGSVRKRYQAAMLGDIVSIDSNAGTKSINVGGMLDVICRNYWWNDNIVSRHYPERPQNNFNNVGFRIYGPECMSQGEYGFPRYVCMQNDYKLKGNPFFKIKIKGKSVLYRKVGEIEKSYATGDKAGQTLDDKISIYAPVPKAGYRAGDVQQYEFYADYETPSLFNDNKLSTTMSIESVRNGVEKLVTDYNNKPAGELVSEADYQDKRRYELKLNWETEEIPEVYDILNTDVYKKYDDSIEPKHGNVFIVPYSQGKSAWYTLNKKSNVILNLVTSDDESTPKVPEGSEDKIVTINITKPLSKQNIETIKDLLSTGYKWVNVTSTGNMNASITKQDIEEYLQSFGQLSEKDKAYYRKHTDKLAREIKQFKAAKVLTELLQATGDTGIILHTLFDKFGDTYTSKVIQLAAANLKGIVKSANVHVDAVNYVGKLGMAKRLHYALDSFTESSFVEQDVEQLADDLAKVIVKQTSTERAEKLINDSKPDKSDIDSNEQKAPEVESKILNEVSEESKDTAQNKECGVGSVKKKSKFSVSEDVDDFDTL